MPPEEADYIRKEQAKAFDGKLDLKRLSAVQSRRYYTAAVLRDNVAKVMQEVEAAKRATTQKDAANDLIEILYDDAVFSMTIRYLDEYGKRVPVEGAKNPAEMILDIGEARFVAAAVLKMHRERSVTVDQSSADLLPTITG